MEILAASAWVLFFVLAVHLSVLQGEFKEAAFNVLIAMALLLPALALLCLDLKDVLSPEYRRVVSETRGIKVRAKLPLSLKIAFALILMAAAIVQTWPE